MSLRLATLAIFFCPVFAIGTDIDYEDLMLARSLMRPGYDLAGVQRQVLAEPGYVEEWWHEARHSYLLIRDLVGDGLKDVFAWVHQIRSERCIRCVWTACDRFGSFFPVKGSLSGGYSGRCEGPQE